MSDKPKWPLAEALIVAETLMRVLEHRAERVIIAGSIRRRKEMVGDIELLYIPRYENCQLDLLSEGQVNVTDECIDELIACGQLAKRRNVKSSEMWGKKNKLAVHLPTGIPVDLFATDTDSWWNYLVCRTGPAEVNMKIAQAAREKGWQWSPCGTGFRHNSGHHYAMHPVASEREVFEFVGLPYCEPWER